MHGIYYSLRNVFTCSILCLLIRINTQGGGDLLRSKVIQKEDNKALKHLSLSNTAASILEYVSESTSIEKLTFKSECLMTLWHFTLAPSLT